MATNILRCISAVLSFIILVSYLVLPDKRKWVWMLLPTLLLSSVLITKPCRHPSLLILNFSLAIFLFNMVVFFSIGNPRRLQCADNINPADQDNSALCAAQGAILIFASLATVLWCAALIVNLHVHTVWNSNFFTHRYILLSAICWGIPAVFMAVTLGFHAVKFEFANLCLVSVEYVFDFFFYPMAVIICPSFLLHIFTFIYIAKVKYQTEVTILFLRAHQMPTLVCNRLPSKKVCSRTCHSLFPTDHTPNGTSWLLWDTNMLSRLSRFSGVLCFSPWRVSLQSCFTG